MAHQLACYLFLTILVCLISLTCFGCVDYCRCFGLRLGLASLRVLWDKFQTYLQASTAIMVMGARWQYDSSCQPFPVVSIQRTFLPCGRAHRQRYIDFKHSVRFGGPRFGDHAVMFVLGCRVKWLRFRKAAQPCCRCLLRNTSWSETRPLLEL